MKKDDMYFKLKYHIKENEIKIKIRIRFAHPFVSTN